MHRERGRKRHKGSRGECCLRSVRCSHRTADNTRDTDTCSCAQNETNGGNDNDNNEDVKLAGRQRNKRHFMQRTWTVQSDILSWENGFTVNWNHVPARDRIVSVRKRERKGLMRRAPYFLNVFSPSLQFLPSRLPGGRLHGSIVTFLALFFLFFFWSPSGRRRGWDLNWHVPKGPSSTRLCNAFYCWYWVRASKAKSGLVKRKKERNLRWKSIYTMLQASEKKAT